MTKTVLLIGCGNMGYAMLRGWLEGALAPGQVHVVEPGDALRERAAATGVQAHAAADSLPKGLGPDLVVIAVKPQVIGKVLEAYSRLAGGPTTFLSVAAGTSVATLAAALPGATPIVRCMPNTPAAVGRGMLVCTCNPLVTPSMRGFIDELLTASGRVAFIEDEGLMDAVTAVSGSGPAYVFHFIECLTRAGVAAGLPEDLAGELALQTVFGAGVLARDSESTPATLRRQVTSPGGTTAAALAVFMGQRRLETLVEEAVAAAAERSRELGRGT